MTLGASLLASAGAGIAAVTPVPPGTGQPVDLSDTIVATIGWSEWCPPGQVKVHTGTGRYTLIPPAPRRICASNPRIRAENGQVRGDVRADLYEAARSAHAEGLVHPACLAGNPPPELVISNATGPHTLTLDGRAGRLEAPPELGCWTPAAVRLQRLLEDVFASRTPDYRPEAGDR